ncbi:NAD(P)-dependent oxidoreductase [Baekduia soli]|uniref:NAD(P)-dependent oxidoreductase n=1 Tax=Baekduia soli TaxID=496014 RepID=A0A5B8U9N3_9ACTN|nr:NAD(P)-dependent oxidoreductase [Baekduia soli]QEC49876.1 NAD(P)-dependent oxidoreductase [Baekduia soli]
MRIFLAGATGAVGARMLPMLIDDGHEVVAMTRTAAKAGALREAGALPVVADGLDRDAVRGAVLGAEPEVVVHHLTALRGAADFRRFDATFAQTNRLRTEGTRHLLDAARDAGARRIIAQSYAGWPFAKVGGPVKDERAALDDAPPRAQRRTLAAIRELERSVAGARGIEGVVLRYGALYGPGTSLEPGADLAALIVRRRMPVVGSGAGVWSFTHVDDAAGAAVRALDHGAPGVYNVVDDDPAPVAVWLPEVARLLGAPEPRRVPRWIGRLAAGEVGVSLMTRVRGASNALARRELEWAPRYPSWREGLSARGGP